GSEVGAIELDDYRIVEKGRLGPGQMFALDLERHQILHDAELKRELASSKPWKTWIKGTGDLGSRIGGPSGIGHLGSGIGGTRANGHFSQGIGDPTPSIPDPQSSIQQLQLAFGYTSEDLKIVLRPMGAEGQDAVWSMGDDTPVAPFARAP